MRLRGKAVPLARRNVRQFQVRDRVEFREGDPRATLDKSGFHGHVDLLACYPPYVSSKKVDEILHEIMGDAPTLTLESRPLRIRIIDWLIWKAPRFRGNGGCLALEVGVGQGSALMKRLSETDAFPGCGHSRTGAGSVQALVAEV